MKYTKIIKYLSWALLFVSAAIAIWAYAINFTDAAVDTLLYWAYAMVGVGILAAVIIGVVISAINNPKSLINILIGIVGVVVVVAIAYFLAPGSPAIGYVGPEITADTLKFTDTILNLTYLACGAAVIAIIVGAVMNAVRSK